MIEPFEMCKNAGASWGSIRSETDIKNSITSAKGWHNEDLAALNCNT